MALESVHGGPNDARGENINEPDFLNSIVEHIPNMIVVKEVKELRFVLFNKASEEFFGHSNSEIIGKNYYDLFSRNDADILFAEDQSVITEKKPVDIPEETIHTKPHGLRILHTKKIPILDAKGEPTYLMSISEDITDYMINKEALNLLESAVHQSSEAFIITSAECYGDGPRILFVNPAYTSMTGYSPDEVSGKAFAMLLAGNDASRTSLEQITTQGNILTLETVGRRKDGSEFISEWNISPLKDDKGEITHLLALQRDITLRKKSEQELKGTYVKLKEMQRDLIQSEKMAALGRFSSGVAHEVKNPLGIILGGIEFLEKKMEGIDPDITVALGKIKDATLRADVIVHGLLKFARPSELKTEIIKPDVFILEALSLMRYAPSVGNIHFDTELSREELLINVDRGQLQQVIFNLLVNAIDAMPQGGRIGIKTSRVVSEGSAVEDGQCAIEVIDEGEGISEENLQKIFEPFFTTKREKRGVGLGLCMSKMIVENHKGALKIESRPGKGTQVKILLPIAKSKEMVR